MQNTEVAQSMESAIFALHSPQGRIQDFWKGGYMYKGLGFRFADFIYLFFSYKYTMKMKQDQIISFS